MNTVDMAQRAYGMNAAPVKTNRSAEYEIFTRLTRKILAAERSKREGFVALTQALFENRRLWSALALDVAQKENALPPALRAQIFYLAEFVETHTRKVLKGQATAQALVDVNTSVMRGLAGEGSTS
ncbi:flagellar biosynthesis regulator FlaF [Tropicimonas isoalkanivorans]|uniref:Flagellar protein FlaF n=1 Tax=Tropicimonas isoalkanivorans TaxID=441112 RepID=A0A1I1RLE1_9RHOB|nr:flagellar biosynthesis regulator FlaF [Tropicimonas isoalkanivorans]SFD35156.1 flagellar protein FlaF [Tropicimonas isoalkanivorans]